MIDRLFRATAALLSVFVLLYGGWILITKTLATGQVTPALGVKMGYTYLAAPISGFFFTLFCLENLVALLRGDDERFPKAPPTDS